MSRPRAVVVGGGVSGLVAALDLARAGADVEVVEASGRVGGSLDAGAVGGVGLDLGAESFLARRPEVVDLARDLGVAGDVVRPAAGAPRVLRDGRPVPLPAGTVLGVPADAATLAGLLDPAEVARAVAEVDVAWTGDTSVAEAVGARLGPAVVDRLVEPLLGGVYAGDPDRLSAAATLPGLVTGLAAGRSLTATAAGVLAAAPAGEGPLAGLAGGLGRLPGLLAARLAALGVRVTTGERVLAVEAARPGATDGAGRASSADAGRGAGHADTAWRVRSGGRAGTRVRDAHAVVVAAPAPAAGALLAPHAPAGAAYLAALGAADVAVVALAVRSGGWPSPLRGTSGVLVPAAEGRRLGYAVKALTVSSAKWDWVGRQDPSLAVVRASVGRAGDSLATRGDADLVAAVVADLSALGGTALAPHVVDTVVRRWPGSLPQYPVGHVAAVARLRSELAGRPGLAVAGNALDGVGLAACVASGHAAADAVAGALAPGRVPVLSGGR